MGDVTPTEVTPGKITRRDFLKLSFWGLASSLIPLSIFNFFKEKPKEPNTYTNDAQRLPDVQSTQIAGLNEGVEGLRKQGFPEKLINSTVQIVLKNPEFVYEGSGSVGIVTIENIEYWFVLTAGHLPIEAKFQTLIELELDRQNPLPNSGTIKFNPTEFGIFAKFDDQNLKTGDDFGVIIFPRKKEINDKMETLVKPSLVLQKADLSLNKLPNLLQKFYSIGFPATDIANPSYGVNMSIDWANTFEDAQLNPPVLFLDDIVTLPGWSGGPIFSQDGMYIGLHRSVSGIESLSRKSLVTNLASIGESGFDSFLKQAVADFKSKQTAKP